MCGIAGIFAWSDEGCNSLPLIQNAVKALHKRGPDSSNYFIDKVCALGHARLSIIDTSESANQPFFDQSGRYVIVFNGEIFNFQELKKDLSNSGVSFLTHSDTEVLLALFIKYGEACLQKLSGFFSFAIFDKESQSLFIARDRFGVKPLVFFRNEHCFLFASELKALFELGIPRIPDLEAIEQYLHLNYIPGPETGIKNVTKMNPGSWLKIKRDSVESGNWYEIECNVNHNISYNHACSQLVDLLDHAVSKRLVSDVPLGAFLSGGIDSSAVVALASKHVDKLKTFSIGYADEPLFDETHYAQLVAKKFNTDHTVFKLRNQDLFNHLFDVLDYIDEPFADSSALAVHILSRFTRKDVTVALSGDGADELFGGYRKHQAEAKLRKGGILPSLVAAANPIIKKIPQSRNSKWGNIARKLNKFGAGYNLSPANRYWKWCGYGDDNYPSEILAIQNNSELLEKRKAHHTRFIGKTNDMNEVLLNDMHLVLPGDMLVKVDLMSMANSLEIRSPFLDKDVVDFAFTLPAKYKVTHEQRKKIVQDSFRSILPAELYNRPKQGFEVPLLKWFRTDLESFIFEDLLHPEFLEKQGIFRTDLADYFRTKLFSENPGDVTARLWGIIVLQYWWKKYLI
jgi:asparagine synthase (glutamine-hydrolysing)